MIKTYTRFLAYSLCALMLTAVLIFQTACDQTQLDRAAKASNQIAHYTGSVITLVDTLWTTGVIKDIKVKDLIAQKLKDFSISGNDFNELVITANNQYKTGVVPTAVWQDLITHFDQLTKIFVDLLNVIPKLTGITNSTAFKIITAAVVVIAQTFINVAGISVPRLKAIKRLVPDWETTVKDYSYAFNA